MDGYTGTDCELDINECADDPSICNYGECMVHAVLSNISTVPILNLSPHRTRLDRTAVTVRLATLEPTVKLKSMNVTPTLVKMEESAT